MAVCVRQAPLFLLFLDATWQLLEQHPAAFEFSETYLAVLCDSTRIVLFGTFLFNCPHQRVRQSTVSVARAAPGGRAATWRRGTRNRRSDRLALTSGFSKSSHLKV